ncbi:MAG TPA: rhodanese-like domain-containing protein [Puia sp.]|nr:rhodanese-like domain-containing protein [Puia sp.]
MNVFNDLFGKTGDLKTVYLKGATILDVRSSEEFRTGHIKGAVNIPLGSLNESIQDLQKAGKPVIACCKSGVRSRLAHIVLSRAGLEAYNGGPWETLESVIR